MTHDLIGVDIGSHNEKARSRLTVLQSSCLTEKLLLLFHGKGGPLANQFISKYPSLMTFNTVRRLLAILLALSLTLGPAVSGVHASSMGTKMAMISLSGAHAQGSCTDCPESKSGLSLSACSACCTGVPAVSPDVAAIDFQPTETQRYLTPSLLADHRLPPDPYPPRSTVLG